MLAKIYREQFGISELLTSDILKETETVFSKAINRGVPRSTTNRTAFQDRLKNSTDVFSVFKVHTQAQEIARQITDDQGNRRSFSDWAARVQPYLNHQNKTWLRTEYDTAIRRAHDEADWQRFEEDSDIYQCLEWIPTTSAHPGADHQVYWGTVLPIHDEFWTRHRPGDRWNCKCSLRQTNRRPNTPTTPRPAPTPSTPTGGRPSTTGSTRPVTTNPNDPQSGLNTKPGSAEVFSDDHAYYPEDCRICPFSGTLRALATSLGFKHKGCNTCERARKAMCELGANAVRARRTVNAQIRKEVNEWATSDLPTARVGLDTAKRDTVNGIVINKRSVNEVYTKNAAGKHLPEVLQMLMAYKTWIGGMKKVRTEPGRNHPNAVFNVYTVTHRGSEYEVKTKVEGGDELLYNIKKVGA